MPYLLLALDGDLTISIDADRSHWPSIGPWLEQAEIAEDAWQDRADVAHGRTPPEGGDDDDDSGREDVTDAGRDSPAISARICAPAFGGRSG